MNRSCNWFANDIVLALNVKHITGLSSSALERLEENWLCELIKPEVNWNRPCRMLFYAAERWLEINVMQLLICRCYCSKNRWSWRNHNYWMSGDARSAMICFIHLKSEPVLPGGGSGEDAWLGLHSIGAAVITFHLVDFQKFDFDFCSDIFKPKMYFLWN